MIFFFSYTRNKVQKQNFLQSKKIRNLLKEQKQIFQNLPDGAVIHRKHITDENGEPDSDMKESDKDLKVIPGSKISFDIRYLNNTFREMFTDHNKLQQKKFKD